MATEQYGASFFENYRGWLNQYWWARRFYASLILRYRKSGKLLELGCGLGHVLQRLEDHFQTYGVDVSEYAIEQARKNTPKSDLRVAAVEDVESLPGPFDVIAAFHVVEHLEDPLAVLKSCARMTTPGGLLIIATPNTEAPFAKKKGPRWYANTDPTHISLKPPKEWTALLRQAGYRIKRAFGDGLWDVPYLPVIPAKLQIPLFGAPSILQTVTTVPFIPVRFSEALIAVAERE
jgi:2-polyprenyl-3-methyl-5-hydroxy-6-metoxy-1,4-benzoquinol methylase